MQRDLDLIRELLLSIDERTADEARVSSLTLDVWGRRQDEINEQLALLIDAGYIAADLERPLTAPRHYIIAGLTESGHRFLNAVTDPMVWERVKADYGAGLARTSLPTIRNAAIRVARRR